MNRPARIMHFINSLGMGGAEKRLTEIVERLAGPDFFFRVVCLSRTGHYEARVRGAGAGIDALGYRGLWQGWLPRPLEPWRMARRLRRCIADFVPDALHSWLPIGNVVAAAALRPARFRSVALIQSRVFTGEYRVRSRPIAWAERWAAKRADLIYCNSQAVLDDVGQREPYVRASQLRLVRNGVDVARFRPCADREEREAARAICHLAEDEYAVTAVAALRPHKGHADLLQAAEGVLKAIPGVRFLLAGPDQGEGPGLRAMAERPPLRGRIEFLGERSDVHRLLRAADVFALPSLQEGLPNALLEAMACGLPCVATDLPGCREALGGGEAGRLAPAGQPGAFAGALIELVGDANLRIRLGGAARARAEALFSLDRMFEEFEALYREAASR